MLPSLLSVSLNHFKLMGQVEGHAEEADRLVGALCSLLLGICLDGNDNSEETCQK